MAARDAKWQFESHGGPAIGELIVKRQDTMTSYYAFQVLAGGIALLAYWLCNSLPPVH
jgi:hypothetical protein